MSNCSNIYNRNKPSSFGIKWPTSIKYLGINMGYDKKSNCIKNWDGKSDEIGKLLQTWEKRELHLFGKVLVVKCLAVSKIVLCASLQPVPKQFIHKLNKIIYKFLWGKRHKISRKKVIKNLEDGGLNMVDLQSLFDSFKAFWLKRLITSGKETENWTQIPLFYINKYLSFNILLNCKIDKTCSHDNVKKLSPFWQDVLEYSSKLNYDTENYFTSTVLSQQIWLNKLISERKINKKDVLLYRNWIPSGILFVKDLPFKNGILDCESMYNIVKDKQNLFIEIQLVYEALRPYKHYISIYIKFVRLCVCVCLSIHPL